jgi:rhodanese-related sulfurtransferase
VSSIGPADLIALIDRGDAPHIVDVRSRAEFVAGHVPGAINVPFTQAWSAVPKVQSMAGDRVIVYCGHGPRAWIASLGLRRCGVRQIVYLRGHWAGWRRAGLRVERPGL